MIPSPYTPGSVPLILAGRDNQLAQVREQLGSVATYGTFIGRVRVETGSRGVGKTSLLKAVQDTANEAGFVTAWATARNDDSLVTQVAHQLSRGLDQIGVPTGRASRVSERVSALTFELGAGPAKAGVTVDVEGGSSPTPATQAFRELISEGTEAARQRGSAGICLLVDELQEAPATDLRTLAYAWQEMQVQHRQPAAAMFAAGLPNTPDVLTKAVTFTERFAFRPLERLTATEAAEALINTAASAEITWADGVVAKVVDRAQGYPYFVQLYGDAVWESAAPQIGTVLTLDDLDRAEATVALDTQAMFRARWAKASPGEQRFLSAMAEFGEAAKRSDLALRLGVPSQALGVPRRRLMDKGLIESGGHGWLRFSTPGFGSFIREEEGIPGTRG